MTYFKNPISRFVLRRDFVHRVRYRLRNYKRLLTKDLVEDTARLLGGRDVRTILDVGANVGFMTFEFEKRFPHAHIHSFEPNPTVFATLQRNYTDDPRVHCHQMGVGDVSGELTFNINANAGTSSFLPPTDYHLAHLASRPLAQQTVRVVRLDDFAEEHGLEHVDILKLDVEGYELKALEGATRLLENQQIDVIHSEVNIVRSYQGQALFHELTASLEQRGYHLFNFAGFIAHETKVRQAVVGDAVYVSEAVQRYLESTVGKENCGW